ncbi:adenylate/guanylate cyclase domain-containing protein [Dermatobacter hominis]|uniref:adenylate/guanylate cyclase domain-containing protein n=1 Tax=Dermatobacter hominis TaxID=2884263 RepID=UPI001D0FB27F|nr:adenylate/guanylate cyclase domain-containing protein [Dermatobacter hominis]UDY34219.1 adenylate/guanylate cyclase domain-containing protein [Dermatobacter hominis]
MDLVEDGRAADEPAFEAAGLYDPAAPDAEGRLALLCYLSGLGAGIERLRQADAEEELVAVGLDLLLEEGGLTVDELASRMDVAVEDVVEAYRLVGVEIADRSAPVFEESELAFVSLLTATVDTFPEDATREILRAISLSLASLSAAAISAFVGSVEVGLAGAGDPLGQATVTRAAGQMGLELAAGLKPLLRHHLRQGVQRQRRGTRQSGDRLTIVTAVGFVDLVGFTARTAELDIEALIHFIGEFRERTHELVEAGGGQVVKHIGDEIMFSCADLGAACRIALSLVEAFDTEGAAPRGGLAAGRVVARHGDLYGSVVNLASRLADTAVPGEVLAPADAAGALAAGGGAPDIEFVAAGRRQLKGFEEAVAVVSVERSA